MHNLRRIVVPTRPAFDNFLTCVSYCTSFRLSHGDSCDPCRTWLTPTTSLDDFEARWNVPEPASKAVRVTFLGAIISECRAPSSRNRGRDHSALPGDIARNLQQGYRLGATSRSAGGPSDFGADHGHRSKATETRRPDPSF